MLPAGARRQRTARWQPPPRGRATLVRRTQTRGLHPCLARRHALWLPPPTALMVAHPRPRCRSHLSALTPVPVPSPHPRRRHQVPAVRQARCYATATARGTTHLCHSQQAAGWHAVTMYTRASTRQPIADALPPLHSPVPAPPRLHNSARGRQRHTAPPARPPLHHAPAGTTCRIPAVPPLARCWAAPALLLVAGAMAAGVAQWWLAARSSRCCHPCVGRQVSLR